MECVQHYTTGEKFGKDVGLCCRISFEDDIGRNTTPAHSAGAAVGCRD
jgi:hypothetical protein